MTEPCDKPGPHTAHEGCEGVEGAPCGHERHRGRHGYNEGLAQWEPCWSPPPVAGLVMAEPPTDGAVAEELIADLRARLAHLQAEYDEMSKSINYALDSGALVSDAGVAAYIDSLRKERGRLWAEAEAHKAAQGRLLVKIAGVAGERDQARAELADRDALLDAMGREVTRLHGECRDAHERIERVRALPFHASGFRRDPDTLYVDLRDILDALGPDGEAQ